jgi:acetylornithine aminotransferase/acetylornithine/N-succinyldiaminopimelate aminotransferase
MTLTRGEGCFVWDAENRRYLDFATGIAVNTIGHAHPYWVEKVTAQAGQLVHVSNLYHVPQQAELAQRICGKAGEGKVFFCNSGAEANEFLIKLARLWGRKKAGGEEGECFKVITAFNAFHGRTFGGMSATPQAKIQNGFGPMLDGFLHGEFNNLDSFRELVDDSVTAILLETIQGEGGIHPATTEFLQGIRDLCDEKGLMLLIDEVQCGIGRTGKFFAFEHAGIQPDAIAMAKGLGGGFPIGAAWVSEPFADLFTPGSHGTTYGGNPLACTAALAVLDVMEQEQLLEKVTDLSVGWHATLEALVAKHPQHLSGMRGVGYHAALVVKGDPMPWVNRLRENGLLVVRGGTDAIRLMPPLNIDEQELNTAVEILDFIFGTHTES